LVRVNDAWLSVARLLKGHLGGNVTAHLVDGHDPNGLDSSGTIPPQCSFHRRTNIVAPIGTQFQKRTIRPVIDRDKTFQDYLSAGETFVRRKTFEQIFVLRGEDRLVSLVLDEERRSRPRAPAGEPLTREQTRRAAKAVLSLLERGAPQHSSKK
jgi:hypothetical protein